MRKFRLLILLGLLCATQIVWAQQKITGKVTDKDGQPIPGVTVNLKNSKTASVTGADGTFSITADPNSTLIFTSVGYQSVQQSASASPMSITLQQGNNALSEVVVVGYGTRSKRDVTGSIARVSSKEITNT